MASNALICSASSVPLVSNKAALGPLGVGPGPRSVVVPAPKMGRSMVVKALDQSGSGSFSVVPPLVREQEWRYRPALLDSPRYVRAPWRHTEDDKEVMLSFDMPGISVDDVAVTIIGDLLIVDASSGDVDASGRKILSYDTKVHLPPYCLRKEARAVLVNGVLYITLPKIYIDHTTPIIVPVMSGHV